MDLNKVMLIGRVTHTPELKTSKAGKSVATINVATNFIFFDSNKERIEKAEFHKVVFWAGLAENAVKLLKKGDRVFIEGRSETTAWKNDKGENMYTKQVAGLNFINLAPKAPVNNPHNEQVQEVNSWEEARQILSSKQSTQEEFSVDGIEY